MEMVIIFSVMKSLALQIDLLGKTETLYLRHPSPPPEPRLQLRYYLASLGGIASAKAIQDCGYQYPLSSIKRKLKNSRTILSIGAGYHALRGIPVRIIGEWLISLLNKKGPLSAEACIAEIMNYYPHGDPIAIGAWLRQCPKGLSRINNRFYQSKKMD